MEQALLISKQEAGRRLGIGQTKLHELINEGTLQVARIGRRCLVRVDSVVALAMGDASPVNRGSDRMVRNGLGGASQSGLRTRA